MAATGRRRYGAWVFTAAVIIALLALANAKVFSIKYIEVNSEGTPVYTEAQIIKKAGVSTGDSIFTVSLQKVRDRLEQDPMLTVEEVSRVYPDRLYITVLQHGPVAYVTHLGQRVILDLDGVALEWAADTWEDLPEIRGLTIRSVSRGDRLGVDDPAVLDSVCRILAAMQDYDLGELVAYIDVANADTIWIGLREGCRVSLGPAVKVKEKLRWLASEDIQAVCRDDPDGVLILSAESARFEPSKDERDEDTEGH